jgi:hypothetical protein
LVNVRPLRGGRAPHDPLAAHTVQVCAVPAVPPFSHVAPDREKNGSRDRRCPERSRSGRSLYREQSRWGESRDGVFSTPVPVKLWWLPGPKRNFRPIQAVVPTTDSGRSGCSKWSVVVLVETCTCRSRASARGLEGARE